MFGARRRLCLVLVLLLAVPLVGARARADEPEPVPVPVQASEAPAQSSEVPVESSQALAQSSEPLTGQFQLRPRGVLVVNVIYGDRGLLPGAFALYAVRPVVKGDQFVISPNNTTVGFEISGVSLGEVKFTGALDVTLKSPNPLATPSTLAPQFYNAYIAAHSRYLGLVVGQYPDVILPFIIRTTNGFPGPYLPGQIGFTRPQARADASLPLGELFQLRLQGSLGRPITTFQLTEELYGVNAGWPDVQGRVALAAGPAPPGAEAQQRAYELGFAAHLGRRRVIGTSGAEVTEQEFDSWSIGADLRSELPTDTTLKLRFWSGSLLGDYMGGVFHTVSSLLGEPVRARGFLVAATQRLGRGWEVNTGFGRDDPNDSDVGTGERTINEAGFLNVFWDWSKIIGFAIEGSRWHTGFKEQGSTRAWRGELMVITRF